MSGPTFFDWLSLVGIWAAAFATYYAARTALRISREQRQISLQPSVETSHIFVDDKTGVPCVGFAVRNSGFWEATVSTFGFKHALYKGTNFITAFDWSVGEKLPCRVKSAEEKTFFAGVRQEHKDWITDLASKIFQGHSRLARWYICRTIKVCIWAGNGEIFLARPGKGFMQHFSEAARTIDQRS